MGRKSTISVQKIFEAVSHQVAQGDEFRIHDLAVDTGVSVGSLYHHYGSREGITAAAWLDALQAFQKEFLKAIQSPGLEAGERAALVTPQFSRAHRERAVILCVGRRETLLNEKAPSEIRQAVDALNAETHAAMIAYSKKHALNMQACLHGIVAFPLASVRLYLPHKRVPKSVDEYILAAYRSAMNVK
ncbi:TetR/AcrR family transcriptional regulator [Sneathiella sp.]|jgi:AcrR family transcriptional regulator|uniref:TetR/AcrR family transcriptional regulator n=1 Tax=Sneathiella sp. TaxID=1964365 RepID=UPI0039E59C66